MHLLSASCFIASYILVFYYPAAAALVGWLLAMVLRQTGHFFFEPKSYDEVNKTTHNYKESVKVGYNLQRKVVLLSLWALVPVVLFFEPTFFGIFTATTTTTTTTTTTDISDISGFVNNMAMVWLVVGLGAIVFRTVHLFKLMGVQSGFVWFTKIATDPFHDIKIYHKSLYYIMKGEMYDNMDDWYEDASFENKA